jgi:nicotinamidase-related amidase
MDRYLFVIDYQKDFVDGTLGFSGAEQLDAGIAAKVRAYGPGRVLFTRDTHEENYLDTREGKLLPVVHCVRDTPGWQVYGETARALEEVGAKAIDKKAFAMDVSDPAVAAVLPQRADTIELVGLVSNICVISNAAALQAKYPEARIRVDASLTDSFDKKLHQAALDVMAGFQVEVLGG